MSTPSLCTSARWRYRKSRSGAHDNAEGSTLRRTLGCLLSDQLGIKLRRVGSGSRYTFTNPGEQVLDAWMVQHAFVTWVETSAPRELETYLLSSSLRLPLNLEGNPWHEAVAIVSAARLKARQEADRYEVACEEALVRDGQPAIVTQAAGKQRLS